MAARRGRGGCSDAPLSADTVRTFLEMKQRDGSDSQTPSSTSADGDAGARPRIRRSW